MSSDRQLVLTRHDLHQLLAKTDTRPDPLAPDPSEYVRTYWEDALALPESRCKVSTGADDCVSSRAVTRRLASSATALRRLHSRTA